MMNRKKKLKQKKGACEIFLIDPLTGGITKQRGQYIPYPLLTKSCNLNKGGTGDMIRTTVGLVMVSPSNNPLISILNTLLVKGYTCHKYPPYLSPQSLQTP